MHRSFSHPAVPVRNEVLPRNAGSVRLLSHVENESDLQFQECHGQLEEYYRTLTGLSVPQQGLQTNLLSDHLYSEIHMH